ncbi:conserved hypothetical protein [Talaromyces stipitatus ATCC 10500]|uniref:Uncharacterized protein n=1 Tax=Talaromyces stipitatus (strain ATCC 10500 / CBS 375.48 / QM 6759 / NRRL 1006) TaxID=441959 RepID=B8M4Z0_TALSN|nr:uncharacterized protein TSTA_027220 [Talaromyces stipitatus ATCC 10500]EED19425.1 conserved hypothetical protein [Talaromyces stipitatus ATCC 10500]
MYMACIRDKRYQHHQQTMSGAREQQYWLPGYGLSRHIVLGHIQYFLGPSASARPFTYQGREGYLINGMPLTREQINDLAVMSREYERQEAARMTTHAGLDTSYSGQASEPYINEPIPVHQRPQARRRPHRIDNRRAR